MWFFYGCLICTLLASSAAAWQTEATAIREDLREIAVQQRLLQQSPESEDNVLSLGSLFLRIGRNKQAAELLQTHLDLHPAATKALRLLAVAYLRLENYALTRDIAERALREGRDAATVEILAMAQLGLQDTDGAERTFMEALKLNPKAVEPNYQLGLLYTKQFRKLPDAIRLLETARALQPELRGVNLALGSALLKAGNTRKAAEVLQTLISVESRDPESYYLLASAYRQLNQPEKWKTTLKLFNTRKREEDEKQNRVMRGRADYEDGVDLLSNSNRLDQAYAALAKALVELPDFDPALYRLAQVTYLQGKLNEAVRFIHRAIQLNPFEPEYHFVLSRCLATSDLPAARDAIDTAVSLRPGVPDFEELQRELEFGSADLQKP